MFPPHVNDQPFTRRLDGVSIGASERRVFAEVHDSVHAWPAAQVRITLGTTSGDRYRVAP
ncbi:MAG: hypothetical protein CMO26_20600 [Thiotrichales bacterium]|nr:hypothetical protein [Thiotrichales bacterium]